ncbi:MAG: N-acetylmuramoyl-L-alanine amidase [Candidatus Bruticola sp.]
MKNFYLFVAAISLFFLLGLRAAPAKEAESVCNYRLGSTLYSIPCITLAGSEKNSETDDSERLFLLVDSEEAERLIAKSGRRFNWSSSGSTLIVFAGPEELIVSADSREIVGPNSQKIPAAGVMRNYSGNRLMEPKLFVQLLNLAVCSDETKLESEATTLAYKVSAPTVHTDADGRKLIMKFPFRPDWKVVSSDADNISLQFRSAVWGEAEQQVHKEHISIEAESEQVNGVPMLTLNYKFPAHWSPILRESFDNKSISIICSPQFSLSAAQQETSALNSCEVQIYENGDNQFEDIIVAASTPFRYFWNYCADCHRLCLYLDNVDSDTSVHMPESMLKLFDFAEASAVGSAYHPILRLEFALQRHTSFTFPSSDKDSTIAVRFFAKSEDEKQEEALVSGRGQTLDFIEKRGIIVLDPGHGGGDPGCYSRALGVYEKQITLDVAMRLRDLLESEGWEVVMTREDDRDVSWRGSPDSVELQSRCDVANNIGADFFISLHCNASVSSVPNGSSVYWCKTEDKPLAKALEFSLSSLGFYQIGTLRESFYVLRNTDMPAVLVEMAYLTNYHDGVKLADQKCRQIIAEELASAINNYCMMQNGSSDIGGRTVRSAP